MRGDCFSSIEATELRNDTTDKNSVRIGVLTPRVRLILSAAGPAAYIMMLTRNFHPAGRMMMKMD
jgi:hypothetical protein